MIKDTNFLNEHIWVITCKFQKVFWSLNDSSHTYDINRTPTMCKALWKIGEWGCHSTMLITVSVLVCSLPWFTKQSTESLLIIIAFFAGPSLQLHVTVNIPEPGWHRLPHRDIPAEVDYLKLYFPKTDQHLLTPWWEQPKNSSSSQSMYA